MTSPELITYIQGQLRSGLETATIVTQLRTSGWQEADIQAAFESVARQSVPAAVATQDPTITTTQLPPAIAQSRMKTGWQLFKQSLAIIKNNPGLSRYVIISTIWVIILFVILSTIYVIDYNSQQLLSTDAIDSSGKNVIVPTSVGYVILIAWIFVQTVITFFYATALSSHVLSIFRAKTTTYAENIALARKKIGPILSFSVINVVVGLIVSTLQRIRFVGWIISKLLDIAWNLASAFAIPLIADKQISGPAAAKESLLLFKANWGPTIVSRISLGGTFFLIYYAIAIPLFIVLGFGLGLAFGVIGLLIGLALFIISLVIVNVIQVLATNVLNVGLYYYATYKVIPPNFSPALLASVFTEKRKK